MSKYILTSPSINGQVLFEFNDSGWLIQYHNQANMPDTQLRGLLGRLPRHVDDINEFLKGTNGRMEPVPEDIGFEHFWKVYDKKINRKRSEPLYNRLSDAQKVLAISRARPYREYCFKSRRGIADPEKYLRDEFFETDWSKER